MNRTEKQEAITTLAAQLGRAQLVAIADYKTITVAEITALRRKFGDAGIRYLVIKNSLARLAMAGTPMEALWPYLKGMNGFILVEAEPITAAKALRELTKDLKKIEKFGIRAGFFDGQALIGPAVDGVADLPGREELLGTLLATINEGPRQLLGVIQGAPRDLLFLLKNFETKLDEASAPAA